MKQTMISLLKRIRVYNLARAFYRSIMRLLGSLVGTRLEARRWAHKSSPAERSGCLAMDHPHRELILKRVSGYAPFQSLLEVGCGNGPNLLLLAKAFPEAVFRGVDINPNFVKSGTKWFKENGVSNVNLLVGKADDLAGLPDKSFDIVLTDAVLIYVGPDKIRKVLTDAVRIARRAVILVEWHSSDPTNLLGFYERHWVRNYEAVFKTVDPKISVQAFPLPDGGGFGDDLWRKWGALIEAAIS
ncbi:MAG: class I SAM-dependent methyltransferase [Thaumarchaeota archaeon]|nr:class I SAM-dependent methyltransferase [Nitrososphaerota archaeon]